MVVYGTLTIYLIILRLLDTALRVLDHCRVLDNGRRLLDTALRVLDNGRRLLDTALRVLGH